MAGFGVSNTLKPAQLAWVLAHYGRFAGEGSAADRRSRMVEAFERREARQHDLGIADVRHASDADLTRARLAAALGGQAAGRGDPSYRQPGTFEPPAAGPGIASAPPLAHSPFVEAMNGNRAGTKQGPELQSPLPLDEVGSVSGAPLMAAMLGPHRRRPFQG